MAVVAKQVAPENQESPLWLLGSDAMYEKKVAIIGGRYGDVDAIPDDIETVIKALDCGEWASEIDTYQTDVANGDDTWYSNLKEIMNDYCPITDTGWMDDDSKVDAVAKIVTDFEYGNTRTSKNDTVCKILNIVLGGNWDNTAIRGYCQGEYAEVIYDKEDVTKEDVHRIEMDYFNMGTEWLIKDTETGNESYEYCYASDDNEIKEEIANMTGCNQDEVTMYKFVGYQHIPQYEEC